ncbi:MAG: DUF2817 domain-containing protein [Chthoniobacter sp.]|nr:DUF2817 domain-containing protein [Chthoniobacter sp.]
MPHRAHDYRHLIARWRAVARTARLPLRRLVSTKLHDLYYLRSKALSAAGGIYISAGVHGDEPGATEGLIGWAEKNVRRLPDLPLLLLPCLNPWGLANNVRLNEDGLDLNRIFHRDDQTVVSAVKQIVAPHQFDAALMLHEDYDGQGLYLYEVERVRPQWGEALLAAARPHLPPDPRIRIDGRKVTNGIHRRRIDPKRFARMGYPEAIWFHLKHAARSLTIETPSEFALERRVAAHMAIIEESVRLAVR